MFQATASKCEVILNTSRIIYKQEPAYSRKIMSEITAAVTCCCCCSLELLASEPCGGNLLPPAAGTTISEHRLLRSSRGFPCWALKQQNEFLELSTNLSWLLQVSPGLLGTAVPQPPPPPPPQKRCWQSHSALFRETPLPGCSPPHARAPDVQPVW